MCSQKSRMTRRGAMQHLAAKVGEHSIYYCLRWCGHIRQEFWFTFDHNAVDGEVREDITGQFDARDLPEEFRTKGEPLEWVLFALSRGFDFTAIYQENMTEKECF